MKKNIFIIFIIALLTSHYFSANGQFIKIPIDDKYQNSELIIEGKFISSRPYIAGDDMIFTENYIEVKKVFKGNSKIGPMISIITLGGTIGDRTDTWTNLLSLSGGDYGTFFLIPTKCPLRDENHHLTTFDVYSGVQGFYKYKKNDYTLEVHAELDSFLTASDFYDRINVSDTLRNVDFTKYDKVNPDSCLKFIINPKGFINTNDPHYYFDISVAVLTGEYSLNQGEIYIQYSNDWFYENMYIAGYIAYFEGDFNNSMYKFSIEDYHKNVLHFKLLALTDNFEKLTVINKTEKLVARIGIIPRKLSSNEEPVSLDLSTYKMENNYRVPKGYVVDFDCVDFKFPMVDCGMTITKIDPLTVAAGVGEVSENNVPGMITITGTKFLNPSGLEYTNCGPVPKNHKVQFSTVDGNWIAPFESDYIEYTDTEIKLKVPSAGYKENGTTVVQLDNDYVAASGPIRIWRKQTNGTICSKTSKDDIKVIFTAANGAATNFDINCDESKKFIIRDMNNLGGYTIFFAKGTKALTNNMKNDFIDALNIWRCETFVDIIIDNVHEFIAGNGNCLISQESIPSVPLPNGTILTTTASTAPYPGSCNSPVNY